MFYRIIYQPAINLLLRNLNKLLSPILPTSIRIPPSGVLAVRLSGSRIKFSTNQTNYTSQVLFWRGPSGMAYTSIFEVLVKKCSCFYDIGAHAGYYSLIAAAQNPAMRIVSFEPAPGPFHYLLENISINRFKQRIHPYAIALGHKNGTTEFLEATHHKYKYLRHNLLAISNLVEQKPGRTMKRINVEIVTLDKFTERSRMPLPDLIKMDTEGTEHLILQHARSVIDNKPIIICETLFDRIEADLQDIMKHHGFLFFNHVDGKLRQVESIVRTEDDGVRDCFFVHPDKVDRIREFIETD